MISKNIQDYDPELYRIIKYEEERQENNIELIASENYASNYVMQLQGSQLTNKYAEGYPSNRYYNGCKYVDMIEKIAIERAKSLFKADYVNVQPHSGSQANFAVYLALLNVGDTVLGMKLQHGGHLTHGSKANYSGKFYNFIEYGIDQYGKIDYQNLLDLAYKYKPKMVVGGFSAYPRKINWFKIRKICDEIGAYFFVDMAHVAGLVIADLYPNPLFHAHVVTTTTHKTLSGPRGGLILSKNGTPSLYRKLDCAVFPGSQGGPLMHIIAAKALAFKEAMDPRFKNYQRKVLENAKIMSNIFISRNINLVSGGTSNHIILIDLTDLGITGEKVSKILEQANIIVNKNYVANDSRDATTTSGIRIGTTMITKRNFKEQDIINLSNWICDILKDIDNHFLVQSIKTKVKNLCSKYPVYFK